jgi:hypothetical protein
MGKERCDVKGKEKLRDSGGKHTTGCRFLGVHAM